MNKDVTRSRPRRPRTIPRTGLLRACLLTGLLMATVLPRATAAPPPPVANTHRLADQLPADLRRILVLPVNAERNTVPSDTRELLQRLLIEELGRTGKFEVIPTDPAQLKARTSRPAWRAEEPLPETLLDTLGRTYACNGILFTELTLVRPYPPLAIGWRMKLVDARDGAILWAVDVVFDAASPTVAADARRYERTSQRSGSSDANWLLSRSPRWFGRYTAARTLETLPDR